MTNKGVIASGRYTGDYISDTIYNLDFITLEESIEIVYGLEKKGVWKFYNKSGKVYFKEHYNGNGACKKKIYFPMIKESVENFDSLYSIIP